MSSGPDGEATAGRSAADENTDVTALKSQLEATQAELQEVQTRHRRRMTVRGVTAAVLVVLFSILLPVSVTTAWAHRTVMNTDAWVATVKPIAADPAVTAAVSTQITNELYQSLDPEQVIAEALPPKASFLAAPIANGAKGYIQQGVNKVVSSEQFQQLWVAANRFAHAQLVGVLRGKSKALTTTNGEVVLNLVPLVNAALAQVSGFASNVVGKPITLPTITSQDVPSAACAKISAALGRPQPATCGQIPLFPADKLTQAQRLVRLFDRATIGLVVLTVALFGFALWASRRRRRTLLQLSVGGLIGLVVVRRVTMWLQTTLVDTGRPENKAARQAIVDHVFHGFFTVTAWVMVVALLVAVVALVTGPYRWAVTTRRSVAAAGRWVWALVTGGAEHVRGGQATEWARAHLDLLRIGGVAVALLLIVAVNVNVWTLLVILALLGGYELALRRLRRPPVIELPAGAGTGVPTQPGGRSEEDAPSSTGAPSAPA